MKKIIQLTEEEYDDLVNKQNEPSIVLRETNIKLKAKIDELQQQSVETVILQSESPFKLNDLVLNFTTKVDFALMYNHLLQKQNALDRPILKIADTDMFTFLNELCETYSYETPFKTVLDVRKYRIALTKTGLFRTNRNHSLILI